MKKTLAILLTLAMLVTGLSTFGVLAEGTAVEISSAKDFVEKIAADNDGSFILTADIDFADYNGDGTVDATDAADIAAGPVSNFNGDTTGVDEADSALLAGSTVNSDGVRVYVTPYIVAAFNGILDGNGKTISGFAIDSNENVDTGLIMNIGGDARATISNLNIGAPDEMISINATGGYGMGCLGGGAMQLDIQNVKVYANVQVKETSTANWGAAGFFGCTKLVTMTKCEFHGSVRSDSSLSKGMNAAGFTARSVNNSREVFTDCINYGNITVSGVSSVQNAAAFLGVAEVRSGRTASSTLIRCINYGTIKSDLDSSVDPTNVYIGGLVAKAQHPISVQNCVNYGDVTSQKYAAEFVALNDSTTVAVTNSVNFGQIIGTNNSNLTTNTNNMTLTLPDTHKGYTPSTSVNFVGSQESEPAENLFNARFLAVVDGLEYSSVGFEIVAYTDTDTDTDADLEEWKYTHDTNNVYDAVKGTDRNGDPYEATAEELGGDYIYALATTAIPANCGTVVFIIKPFAKTASTTVYGAAATCVYTNGVFSSISYVN